MTYVEAFTQAKSKKNPTSNEDRLIAIPDRLYAVIDGATDKSGKTYDGQTGGQIAGRMLEDVLRDVARETGEITTTMIVTRVNRRLRQRYRLLGIAEKVRSEPWLRFSAQAAIAVRQGNRYRFIVIGDAGLRINGCEVISNPKTGDVICAQLRGEVHRHLTKCGMPKIEANKWARAYTVEGLGSVLPGGPAEIGTQELGTILAKARNKCRNRLSAIGTEDIEDVLLQGLKGLLRFRNKPGQFGFPSIDGSPVPNEMIVEFQRPAKSIKSLELFSDGYQVIPDGTTVENWENSFWNVEREDPDRISSHPETKGSTTEKFADDRTVLIIHP